MAKVQALLFIVAFLPILIAYPLEDSSSTETSIKDEKKTDNDGYIEETYIEVLLPGVSRLNSSSINALLSTNNASFINTTEKERLESDEDSNENSSEEDSSEEAHPGLVSAQVSASPRPLSRAVRDIADEKQKSPQSSSPTSLSTTAENKNVAEEKKNSSPTVSGVSSTTANVKEHKLHPALLPAQVNAAPSRAIRDTVDQTQSGSTSSSTTEADVDKQKLHPALLSAQVNAAPNRAIRDTVDQSQSGSTSTSTTEAQKLHPALLSVPEADVEEQKSHPALLSAQYSGTPTRVLRDAGDKIQNSSPTGSGSASTTQRAVLVNKLTPPQSPFAVKN